MESSYEHIVHYYETDQMGVVHHSNYIRWFEEARTDMFEKVGVPYKVLEERGLMLPVVSVNCEYKVPAKYGDRVTVKAKVEKVDSVKIELSYEIRKKDTDELCVKGKTKHCFVNKEFKIVRIKNDYKDIYEKLLNFLS